MRERIALMESYLFIFEQGEIFIVIWDTKSQWQWLVVQRLLKTKSMTESWLGEQLLKQMDKQYKPLFTHEFH